jgi:hypothetical protein
MMRIEQLDQLKRKMVQEPDLSNIWEYYMSNFADLPEFLDVGRPKKDKFLTELVPTVCQKIFGKKVKITNLFPIYIPEHKFFHAPFFADKSIGGLIYYEDLTMGIIAVSASFPPGMMHFSRFSKEERSSLMKGFGNDRN